MNRRHVLSLLIGVFTAPATARLPAPSPAKARRIVIVGGWVLRADDLEKVAAYAA
ncbi:MAG TPA: hypothetical protein VJ045_08490 [Hyphomicrobiaceae bacterium]|nr:hypothetical protein [Hyphomicrobiaceae bacterium]